jgi:acyl-CoA synthetase (AMP-forming)/AMP-acid ligase II
MVIRGGENIYPIEIEGILLTHPNIREAAVYGVPHDHLGEELAATVCADGTVTAEQLQAFVGEQVAGFKIPTHFTISSEPLTKNATGKMLKKVIRQDYLDSRVP